MIKSEKRIPRSYKTTDTVYKKAMKRAKSEKRQIAPLVEEFLTAYGKNVVESYITNCTIIGHSDKPPLFEFPPNCLFGEAVVRLDGYWIVNEKVLTKEAKDAILASAKSKTK